MRKQNIVAAPPLMAGEGERHAVYQTCTMSQHKGLEPPQLEQGHAGNESRYDHALKDSQPVTDACALCQVPR